MACLVFLTTKIMEKTKRILVNLDHVKMIEKFVSDDEDLGGNQSMLIFTQDDSGYDLLHVVEDQQEIIQKMLWRTGMQPTWRNNDGN
jgi:hypothetical protein